MQHLFKQPEMAKMPASTSSEVDVLVTGKLAAAMPPACCGAVAARSRAPFLLRVCVLQSRAAAGLVQLRWRCVVSSRSHSRWVDTGDVAPVTRVADANAALGRGAHESPFEDESGGRVALWRAAGGADDARGRFLVATRHLAIGERVLRAAAFAVAVAQPLVLRRCHWCFGTLVRKALRCGACEFALYCSRECLDADAPLHDSQCRALAQLKRMAGSVVLSEWSSAGVDEETIRLALAVLSMERFVGSTTPLKGLVLHRRGGEGIAREQGTRVLDQTASFIVAGLTSDGHGPPPPLEHVRVTLERVRCNAHPLALNGATTVGVGIFPEAAMALNHSCLPNVVPSFDRRTRMLSFHAIREIDAGQAVEYAYIDLFQATSRRQDALQDGFGFTCDCWRCAHEDKDEGIALSLSSRLALEKDEAAVMTELMQLRGGSDTHPPSRQPHVLADELFRRRSAAFERSPELQFAYRMLQLQLATSRHDWERVVLEAETLERLWLSRGLPETHPMVEVLQLQVHRAADHGGKRLLAQHARERVQEIRRLCGFEDGEKL